MININGFKARLLNALLPLIDPDKIEFQKGNESEFNLDPNTPLITISDSMCEYALAPLNLNYAETILNSKYATGKIPMEILGALFEKAIENELNILSSLIDSSILITDYQNIVQSSNYAIFVDFVLKTNAPIPNEQEGNNDCTVSISIPTRLYFKTETSFENLLEKCVNNIQTRNGLLLKQNIVPIQVIIGTQNFSVAEIKNLKTGDAIILTNCHLDEGKALLSIGDKIFQTVLNIQDSSATIERPVSFQQENGNIMTDENLDISKLNLKLDFILDSQNINIQSLEQLQPGMTINLQNTDMSEIIIMINGQKIGTGRVITIDGKYAVQISSLSNTGNGIQ